MQSGEGNEKGAPNDGFLKYIENTFLVIFFRSTEMHCKRRFKICICSAILGELESFRNYQEFRIIFPKSLDAI